MLVVNTDWSITASEIRVAYRFTNKHAAPVYVYTVPQTALREVLPGTAYAQLSRGDIDLTLLLGTSDPPAGVSVPVRVQPLAVFVPAGGDVAGEVRVPVPVPEWTAYTDPAGPGDAARAVDVYLIRFVVEYVLDGETYFAQQTPDGKWDVGGTPVRRLTASYVPEIPVRVLARPLPVGA